MVREGGGKGGVLSGAHICMYTSYIQAGSIGMLDARCYTTYIHSGMQRNAMQCTTRRTLTMAGAHMFTSYIHTGMQCNARQGKARQHDAR